MISLALLRKIETVATLTAAERRVLIRMVPAAMWIGLALRRVPLATVARSLGVPIARLDAGVVQSERDERDDAVRAAALLGRNWRALAGCLPQSLLIAHALRAREASLAIGVTRRAGELHAHAWVQVGRHRVEPHAPATEVLDFVPLRAPR